MTDEKKPMHDNIYVALCAAQAEFGAVQKGSTNPAFKSKYADLADVASVVIPTLSRHGVAVLHYVARSGEALDMRTEFVHGASGTKVWCDIPLIVDRNNMQGMKSATTYAKRIGLESLSGVAPEDDDGNAATAAAPPRPDRRALGTSSDNVAEFEKAVADAIRSIDRENDLDSLGAFWSDLGSRFKGVASDPRVIAAKNARKDALMPKSAAPDLGGDEIPY